MHRTSAKHFPSVLFIKIYLKAILFVFLVSLSYGLKGQSSLENGIGTLNLLGCGVTSGVIQITGTGNLQANKAYLGTETTLDEIDMNFNVRVDSLNAAGTFLYGIGKYSGIAGTLVEITGTDTTSAVRINRLNGTTPFFITQYNLPFNIIVGDTYKVRVGKRVRDLVVEITSSDSTQYFYIDSLSYPTPFFGCLWGTPFIGSHSGTISVIDFSLTTPLSTTPRLAVWGDSFIEGNSLPDAEQRYVSLIQDSIGYQNVTITGRGGESSIGLVTRFSGESQWLSGSKYGLVAIGVNDNNFSVWENNMLKYLDTLKKRNIVPIIATLTPRADRLPFIVAVNNWIRNVYNGPYLDVSRAVSATETSWDTGMGMSDGIHPTPAGHIAIYERIQLEAPYLFRNTNDFTIDYINEMTFEGIGDSLEYSTNSGFSSSSSGNMTPTAVIPGTSLYFRDTAYIAGVNSLFYILPAPKRPAAPTMPVIDVAAGTFDWTNNINYPNVPEYEFSIDSGVNWITCFEKPIYAPGSTYLQLRVKATAISFKSPVLFFNALLTNEIASLIEDNISVYPNPLINDLIIKNITEETSLTIFSVDGRLVKTALLDKETNIINTDELSTGFYIVTLSNKTLKKNFKIMKK